MPTGSQHPRGWGRECQSVDTGAQLLRWSCPPECGQVVREINPSFLLGILCFCLALAPFHSFASLGCRADGRKVKLKTNVTVRCFVKKTIQTPPNISSFLCFCSFLVPCSFNCSFLTDTGSPCRDKWFTDSCDLYLIGKFRLQPQIHPLGTGPAMQGGDTADAKR